MAYSQEHVCAGPQQEQPTKQAKRMQKKKNGRGTHVMQSGLCWQTGETHMLVEIRRQYYNDVPGFCRQGNVLKLSKISL